MTLLLKIRLLLIQQSKKMNMESSILLMNIDGQENLGKDWKILDQMIRNTLSEAIKGILHFKDIIQQD